MLASASPHLRLSSTAREIDDSHVELRKVSECNSLSLERKLTDVFMPKQWVCLHPRSVVLCGNTGYTWIKHKSCMVYLSSLVCVWIFDRWLLVCFDRSVSSCIFSNLKRGSVFGISIVVNFNAKPLCCLLRWSGAFWPHSRGDFLKVNYPLV